MEVSCDEDPIICKRQRKKPWFASSSFKRRCTKGKIKSASAEQNAKTVKKNLGRLPHGRIHSLNIREEGSNFIRRHSASLSPLERRAGKPGRFGRLAEKSMIQESRINLGNKRQQQETHALSTHT